MRLILLLFVILFGSVSKAAEDALAQVQARLQDAPVVRGEFSQERSLVGVKRPLQSSGVFFVDRKRGVIWDTRLPFANTLRVTADEIVQLDGDTVLMRLSADKEPGVRAVGQLLLALFAGDLGALRSQFEVTGSKLEASWSLQLKPREPGLQRLIRALEVRGDQQISSILLTAASGDLTRIEYTSVSYAESLTADEARAFK